MPLRRRSVIEAAVAAVAMVVAVVTALVPDWLERLLGAAPDGGDGSAERWLALALACCAVLLVVLSRRDARRAALISARAAHSVDD